jgi:hypothetical protein
VERAQWNFFNCWWTSSESLRLTAYAPDLREWEPPNALGALSKPRHTIDVRHVERARNSNIPQVAFFWRLGAWRRTNARGKR